MNPLDALWCDEVPADVRRLIEQFELATEEIRNAAELQVGQVRKRAEAQTADIQQRADESIRAQAQSLAQAVRPLLEGYLKAGKLGEALAIRDRLRQLRTGMMEVLPDPGVLHITQADFGKTSFYEGTGTTQAQQPYHMPVYGTDVYCGDSALAAACVHAGVLRPGAKGVVKVTVLDRFHPCFEGSSRNEVTSSPWQGAYPAFRVSRA